MKNDALMKAVSSVAREALREFNAQEMANAMWAFATLSARHAKLFDAIAGNTLRRLEEFSSLGLVDAGSTFAILELRGDELHRATARTVWANTVWAFTKLEMKEEALTKATSSRTRETLRGYNAQGLAAPPVATARLLAPGVGVVEGGPRVPLRRLLAAGGAAEVPYSYGCTVRYY